MSIQMGAMNVCIHKRIEGELMLMSDHVIVCDWFNFIRFDFIFYINNIMNNGHMI